MLSYSEQFLNEIRKLNKTLFIRDNLEILRCMEDQTVDLIYLDPPFNSNKNYGAPIGGELAGEHFKDMWTLKDTDEAWWGELSEKHPKLYEIIHAVGCINGKRDKAYLIYMAIRLVEMRRVLKDTGSIYLHCDNTMLHSLKLVMDSIFQKSNFVNSLSRVRQVGKKGSQYEKRSYGDQIDHVLFYSKGKKYFFKIPVTKRTSKQLKEKYNKKDKDGKQFCLDNIVLNASNYRPNLRYEYKGYIPKYGWMVSKDKLKQMDKENKLYWNKNENPKRKYFREDDKGIEANNFIEYMPLTRKEKTEYKTQKPLALLEMIIKASCPDNGVVLDPFCGCTTACMASEKLQRKWIGIDISPLASKLLVVRLEKEFNYSTKDIKRLINIREGLPTKNAPRPSKDIKHTLYGKQEGLCAGCKFHFQIQNLTKDHKIPRSKGGQDTDKNIQLLCGNCNSIKGDRSMEYLLSVVK